MLSHLLRIRNSSTPLAGGRNQAQEGKRTELKNTLAQLEGLTIPKSRGADRERALG